MSALARYWVQSSMVASGPGDTLPCVRLPGEGGGQENGQGGERGDSFLCEYNDQEFQQTSRSLHLLRFLGESVYQAPVFDMLS